SDIRFKKDIEPLGSQLDQVAQLNPVTYHWRSEEFPERAFGHEKETGLIAQDVQKALPQLVVEDEQGYLKVRFTELNIYILQAVKELYTQVKTAMFDIAGLKANDAIHDRELAAVKADNEKLKQENAAIKAYLCSK